jgi:hypothetical protein
MDSLRGYCCKPSQRTGNRLVWSLQRPHEICPRSVKLVVRRDTPSRAEEMLQGGEMLRVRRSYFP